MTIGLSATVGTLVLGLLAVGEVVLDTGAMPETGEHGYYVRWSDEWSDVSCWDSDLIRALEKVQRSILAIANYG